MNRQQVHNSITMIVNTTIDVRNRSSQCRTSSWALPLTRESKNRCFGVVRQPQDMLNYSLCFLLKTDSI